jgi:hypothetical protein
VSTLPALVGTAEQMRDADRVRATVLEVLGHLHRLRLAARVAGLVADLLHVAETTESATLILDIHEALGRPPPRRTADERVRLNSGLDGKHARIAAEIARHDQARHGDAVVRLHAFQPSARLRAAMRSGGS